MPPTVPKKKAIKKKGAKGLKKKIKRKIVAKKSALPKAEDKNEEPVEEPAVEDDSEEEEDAMEQAEANGDDAEAEDDAAEEDDEDSDHDQDLMTDKPEGTVNMNFEALPPCEEDHDGLVNMFSQIFLKAEVSTNALVKSIIGQAPFGCVFVLDEEDDGVLYGVVSVLELGGKGKVFGKLLKFLVEKAKKHGDNNIVQRVERLGREAPEKKRIGVLINERMLNFPTAICGPSFNALLEDMKTSGPQFDYKEFIVISKIRLGNIPDADTSNFVYCFREDMKSSGPQFDYKEFIVISKIRLGNIPDADTVAGPRAQGQSKKKGKGKKKQLAAKALTQADVIFDNPEEELLFQVLPEGSFPYFNYPVHHELDKDSKFHSTVKDGETFLAYRRVSFLTREQFETFAKAVVQGFSATD
uniref:N-acetyltransferase domain-containing protein n=1 Tax=Steinernema glaseri TaxID=37863 RepID=A0A1I7YCR8_9BILA